LSILTKRCFLDPGDFFPETIFTTLLLNGRFSVSTLDIYFGGYFGGQLETYPPCIMGYYVLGVLREMGR
jgi:hypothetical protein